MRSLAQARLKRAQAIELLADGKNYDEIAQEVGYSHRGSAHRAVAKALSERTAEDVDLLRAVEVGRLDRLQVAVWDRALGGDPTAIRTVLRIIEQRCRLFGLYAGGATDKTDDGFAALVVGPLEDNPWEATLDDVRRWSRGHSQRSPASGIESM